MIFNGGALSTKAGFVSARGVTPTSDGAIDVAASTTLGLTGVVSGDGGLVKQGSGRLTLSGVNGYTAGTVFEDGIVQISAETNLGGAAGDLTFDGGMLATTASLSSARAVSVKTDGGFDVADSTELELSVTIIGAGALTKLGTGALVLSGS